MCLRTRLTLALVFRTDPCSLLVPINVYVPSSFLTQELIDRVRLLKLLDSLLKNIFYMIIFIFFIIHRFFTIACAL